MSKKVILREISPATNLTCDEYLVRFPYLRETVDIIRKEKDNNKREQPSLKLIDKSKLFTSEKRKKILDKVASLVDENLTGRSDMCQQFALLLARGLLHIGVEARVISGECKYYDEDHQFCFKWDHAWVRVGKEVIDGNADSTKENPCFPKNLKVSSYWGPINQTPGDRKFCKKNDIQEEHYNCDVDDIWLPDLKEWLDEFWRE